VISPVGKLRYKDDVMVIGNGEIGTLSQKIYDVLTGIQLGSSEDPFGWRVKV
jgi:branched-chain amino acid aminotransferase